MFFVDWGVSKSLVGRESKGGGGGEHVSFLEKTK